MAIVASSSQEQHFFRRNFGERAARFFCAKLNFLRCRFVKLFWLERGLCSVGKLEELMKEGRSMERGLCEGLFIF